MKIEELIIRNADILKWEKLNNKFNYSKIDDEIIYEFAGKINLFSLSSNYYLPEDFIRKYIKEDDFNWKIISSNPDLSDEFIDDFSHKLFWEIVSVNKRSLSDSFIKKWRNKLNWGYISEFRNLSEEFMEKWRDKLYWKSISRNQNLSEEFILKMSSYVEWGKIVRFQNLSFQFIEENVKSERIWNMVFNNLTPFSDSFIKRFKNKVDYDVYEKQKIL